jgi:antirestriction protein
MEGEPKPPTQTPDEEPQEYWPDPEVEPRIYVADLAAYNAGVLRGTWIDAAQDEAEIHDVITGMLQDSPSDMHAEEWAIFDFEGFNGLRIRESEDLAHVSKVAKGIKEHGLAYAQWAELIDADEELDQFEDRYLGHWPSRTDYAADVLDDLGLYEMVEHAVSDNLRHYVTLDAEGFGRDLELGGDITVSTGDSGVYIFANR